MEYPVPPVTHVIYFKKITKVNKYHSRFKGDHFLILIHIKKKKQEKNQSYLFVCIGAIYLANCVELLVFW